MSVKQKKTSLTDEMNHCDSSKVFTGKDIDQMMC